MQIRENELLAPYTTFKIGGPARYFCVVKDQHDALEAFSFAQDRNLKTFVLGGGSNLLISDIGFNGLVMKVENKGIEILEQGDKQVIIRSASGEVWDSLVEFAVKSGWWGIENLSHIPGSTGAIAVQNVGAYGQEASEAVDSVLVFDRITGQILSLKNADCGFSYRSSIFNTTQKGRYIIFYITLKLKKSGQPNLSYRDLKNRFAGQNPSLTEMRLAVTEIRDTKFPFPTEAKKGNAGSFFKNPILDQAEYEKLKQIIARNFGPDAVLNLEKKKFNTENNVKVPAAFLIDICALKDQSLGGAGINPSQPLVIINQTGTASAKDVLNLANKVKAEVLAKTGVELNFEPELIGFS